MYSKKQKEDAEILKVLSFYVSQITAQSVLRVARVRFGRSALDSGSNKTLHDIIIESLKLYCPNQNKLAQCRTKLMALNKPSSLQSLAKPSSVDIIAEDSIVTARRKVRTLAMELGFNKTVQVAIVTVISELSRNIWRYAGKGTIKFEPVFIPRRGIKIEAYDEGPGIDNLDEILGGGYRSKTGMGLGVLGCKRLMDSFEITTKLGKGTHVIACKFL